MKSTKASPFDSLKSKKILHYGSKESPSPSDLRPTKAPDQSPLNSKTPEKPANPPFRARNRRSTLSIKEIRQAAEKLRSSDPTRSTKPDPLMSFAKQQIPSWPSETAVANPKKTEVSEKLPEKYKILGEFFNSLDSSIRLLKLRHSIATFTNVSCTMQSLTDRRLSYGHLAQMKFIFPEAIDFKKVLVHDEHTSCMKPVLHIELNSNAIKHEKELKSDSASVQLRKAFHARLLEFYKVHPEGDEVPKAILPEPFNESKLDLLSDTIIVSNSSSLHETSNVVALQKQPVAASHLPTSFQAHFSQRALHHGKLRTDKEPSTVSSQPAVLPSSELQIDSDPSVEQTFASAAQSSIDLSSKPSTHEIKAVGAPLICQAPSPLHSTPIKDGYTMTNLGSCSVETTSIQCTPAKLTLTPTKLMCTTPAGMKETPAKLTSTPAKLMTATPAIKPPKRRYMSPDDDSCRSPNKLLRPRTRSLKFDGLDSLSEDLVQSIWEKERKALEEQNPAISQAKRRKQMISHLPKLVDMINYFFRSMNRSVITKEDLMHRIISSHFDIVDRGEIGEQLSLLQELVPDWIYEKSASSGDILLCINKLLSPESIHSRLAEAK